MQSDGYQVPGVFFAKNDEKPYSNKTTTNPSKLKYLQKFKGKDGGGKYLMFEKKCLVIKDLVKRFPSLMSFLTKES